MDATKMCLFYFAYKIARNAELHRFHIIYILSDSTLSSWKQQFKFLVF